MVFQGGLREMAMHSGERQERQESNLACTQSRKTFVMKVLTLSPDRAVSQNTHCLARTIGHVSACGGIPELLLLLLVQWYKLVVVVEKHHDDPFCDLGAVDSVGAQEGNLGIGVDGVIGDVVDARGEELDEFEVGRCSCVGWEPVESCQIGGALVELYRWVRRMPKP